MITVNKYFRFRHTSPQPSWEIGNASVPDAIAFKIDNTADDIIHLRGICIYSGGQNLPINYQLEVLELVEGEEWKRLAKEVGPVQQHQDDALLLPLKLKDGVPIRR